MNMKTKSKKAKAESANYLDYVPMHNEDKYPFQTDDNGAVTIMVENKGVFNKIAQVVFRKPRISKIHLDDMGNFIWPYIDGTRTYKRLVQYFKTLESYGFITFNK